MEEAVGGNEGKTKKMRQSLCVYCVIIYPISSG